MEIVQIKNQNLIQKIKIQFNKTDKIQIIIDVILKSILFNFEIYDFVQKEFTESQIYIIMSFHTEKNNFEIPICLRIIFPFLNKEIYLFNFQLMKLKKIH